MAQYIIDNRPAPIDFEEKDRVRRTIQSAKNLLMTRMGETPYDRFRGFDAALYDLPIGRLKEQLIRELDRVMLWEVDAEVVDANCYLDKDGQTIIECRIEIDFE